MTLWPTLCLFPFNRLEDVVSYRHIFCNKCQMLESITVTCILGWHKYCVKTVGDITNNVQDTVCCRSIPDHKSIVRFRISQFCLAALAKT